MFILRQAICHKGIVTVEIGAVQHLTCRASEVLLLVVACRRRGFLHPIRTLYRKAATMLTEDHENALRELRTATSAYARDPSDRNAAKVQFAFGTVNDLKQMMWREHYEKWLQSN